MTRNEFAEMVEYLEDAFGPSNDWMGAARIFESMFADLETDLAYEAILARRDGDPEKARWCPKPAELRALVLERQRRVQPKAIPETTERYGWEEYSRRTYGKVISLGEAIQRRAKELEAV